MAEQQRGSLETFGGRLIYDNKWVKLGLADAQAPNGARWEYHVVHLARIAIGLVVDERDRVLMLWRYRFPTDQWGYELLGGLVEEGEDPAETARRELEEETGYRPVGEPEHLVGFEPLPGQVTANTDVYHLAGCGEGRRAHRHGGGRPAGVGAAEPGPGVRAAV